MPDMVVDLEGLQFRRICERIILQELRERLELMSWSWGGKEAGRGAARREGGWEWGRVKGVVELMRDGMKK
jgi:hypothetical protein